MLYGRAIDDLVSLLSNILSSVTQVTINDSTEPLDPTKWVVGVDPNIEAVVGSTRWSGYGVVGVYTENIVVGPFGDEPSTISLEDSSGQSLIVLPISVLPYFSHPQYATYPGTSVAYILAGTLRVAILAVDPGTQSPQTAYI